MVFPLEPPKVGESSN